MGGVDGLDRAAGAYSRLGELRWFRVDRELREEEQLYLDAACGVTGAPELVVPDVGTREVDELHAAQAYVRAVTERRVVADGS